MFNRFLTPCCKEHVCDCCLNGDEIINKDINTQLKRMRRQNLQERKLLLLGKKSFLYENFLFFQINFFF